MRSPVRPAVDQFLRTAPLVLLLAGIGLALLDFAILYIAAEHEHVLRIPKGIGLLQDYGLISTVAGDAILIYLARRYYDAACSIRSSKALTDPSAIDEPLATLTSMIRMEGNYGFVMIALVTVGALFWMSNLAIHLFGDPVAHWHHKVFDSKDHLFSFFASRFHNIYTYVLVYPFTLHVLFFVSRQFRRMFSSAIRNRELRFDLLNPDHRGGFSFVYKSHAMFNLLVAILYVQLAMHVETFEHMNIEHYFTLAFATLLLIFGNRIFLGDVFGRINGLRVDALNERKDKAYDNDVLSFEILKYCYQRRVNRYSLMNIATKAVAIGVSVGPKVYPLVSKVFTPT